MTQFRIIETSIDIDNYLYVVLCDEHNNVQMFNIRTCERDDDIVIVQHDDDAHEDNFEFHMHRITRAEYDAMT